MSNLLEVRGLTTQLHTVSGKSNVIEDLSLSLPRGQTLGLVGESGCGKSMTAMSILGLLPKGTARVTGGEILFQGRDLTKYTRRQLRKLRGGQISIIFQEPMTALNPVYKIGKQMREVLLAHRKVPRRQAKSVCIQLLKDVGISRPEQIYDDYPYSLSGGMLQRVMIAMALACQPALLIADEPTTALDVTIQAQILELMQNLKAQRDMSVLMITHNLGVVAEICDRVAVMYAGSIVEEASVSDLFDAPAHPYTKGLMACTPDLRKKGGKLPSIPGVVAGPGQRPQGCRFAPRCSMCTGECLAALPPLREISAGHKVRCFHAGEKGGAQ